MVDEFKTFLTIDLQRAPKTVDDHSRYIRKFISLYNEAELDEIREFMKSYMGASVSGYCNSLKAIKIFFRDFLKGKSS